MRKILLTLFLLVSLVYSKAQNWAPLNSHDKYNYRLTGTNIVSVQIKADSAQLVNGDSVYYLNRIARYNSTGSLVSNLPQFLQRQVTLKGNGVYNFTDTLNLALYTLAPANYSWVYDSTNNISARIEKLDTATIFNTLDSIRVIRLSSNDTIVLSKSFGIIKYPYKYGVTDSCYTLTGIEGRNLGELLPKFKDFFNWDVGDMFEIHAGSVEGSSGSYETAIDNIYKYTVLNKYTNEDTLQYIISLLTLYTNTQYNYNYYASGGVYITSNSNSNKTQDTLIFVNSPTDITNNYPNQYVKSYSAVQPYFYYTGILPAFPGQTFNSEGEIIQSSVITSISKPSTIDSISIPGNNAYSYEEGLGLVYYTVSWGGYNGGDWQLKAYRKGNDTVGTFTSDSALVPTAIIAPQTQKQVLVYPNPATNNITIVFKDAKQGTITLSNLQGQLIKKEDINSNISTIDISSLAPGMYLLSITTETGTEYVKVVKQY